ncbi:MAG: SDR family oxidoreductase, partial [Candidatus Thiodiazotropha sp.]
METRLQFSLTLSYEDLIVRDHRLFQERTMPGVAFVDIVLRFLNNRGFDLDHLQLRNISLKQAVVVSPAHDRQMRLTLVKNEDVWSVRACSRSVKDGQAIEVDWLDNMECELHLVAPLSHSRIDIESLKSEAIAEHDFDRTYAALRNKGIEHYQFMKLHGRIHEGRDYLLAEVTLGDLARQYENYFCMHPTLLDGAVCLMGMLQDVHEKRTFVPVYFGSFQAFSSLPGHCFILLRQHAAFKSDSDIAYFDFDIYDEQGGLLASCRRVGVLHLRSSELIKQFASENSMNTTEAKENRSPAQPMPGAQWRAVVVALVEKTIGRPLQDKEAKMGFYDLGLDSQDLLAMVKRLESQLGSDLYPTLLFEHNSIEKLIAYLVRTYPEQGGGAESTVSPEQTEASRRQEFCYLPVWLSQALPALAQASPGETLVVYTQAVDAMRTALAAHHSAMWEIVLGTHNVRRSARCWEIDLNDKLAIAHAFAEAPQLRAVYFLGALIPEDADPLDSGALEQAQQKGLDSLFRLLKALHGAGYGGAKIALKVVTTDTQRVDADDRVYPHGATVHGFIRTVAKEYPHWICSLIDLDLHARRRRGLNPCWDDWAAALAAESDLNVVLRDQRRLVHGFRPLPLFTTERNAFRNRGVYLLVGAGGIALTLAYDLAQRFAARVVLVGRSEPDEVLRDQMGRIESAGGEVLYLRADTSDEAAMARVVATVRARFGEINGTMHTAAVLRDRMLVNMDEADLRAALTPKVQGCVAMCRALRGVPLDFLLFFSSALSFSGSIGQANYTAASSFEDALAQALDSRIDYPVQTIDWGNWGEVGMVATDEYRQHMQERGFYPIGLEEGLALVEKVLSAGIPQVLAAWSSEETLRSMGVETEVPKAPVRTADSATTA